MEVVNKLSPNYRQSTLLDSNSPKGPIYLLNLIKFKDQACYDDGRESNLNGYAAYRIYSQSVVKLLPRVNAEILFGSQIVELLIGAVDQLWDEVTIVKFNSKNDYRDLLLMPEWQEINIHREAGIEGSISMLTVGLSIALNNDYEL